MAIVLSYGQLVSSTKLTQRTEGWEQHLSSGYTKHGGHKVVAGINCFIHLKMHGRDTCMCANVVNVFLVNYFKSCQDSFVETT